MAAETKASVKAYFKTGDKPTEAEFSILIDSYQDFDQGLTALTSAATAGTPPFIIKWETVSAASAVAIGAVGETVINAATTAAAQDSIALTAVTSAEAGAGTGTDTKSWTPQLVHQAIDARALTQGKHADFFPVQDWTANVSGGAGAIAAVQYGNGVQYLGMPFDAATEEAAQALWQVPLSVDRTVGIDGRILWTGVPAGGSYDVVWRVRAVVVGNGDGIDAAFGSYVSVTATGSQNSYRIATFTGLVPGGTWSTNKTLIVEISRDAANVADTLTGDAQFFGLHIDPVYNLPNND